MKKAILAVMATALLSGCSASKQQRAAWQNKSNAQVIECAAESQNVQVGGGAGLVSVALSGRRYDACYSEFNRRADSGEISQQEYAVYMAMTQRRSVDVNVNHTW